MDLLETFIREAMILFYTYTNASNYDEILQNYKLLKSLLEKFNKRIEDPLINEEHQKKFINIFYKPSIKKINEFIEGIEKEIIKELKTHS